MGLQPRQFPSAGAGLALGKGLVVSELVGAAHSLWGPDRSTVIFTSHFHLELSIEYFCHILVLSSVGKDFLPALLVNPLRMLFALGLFYSPPPPKSCHEILLEVFGCWRSLTVSFKVLPGDYL